MVWSDPLLGWSRKNKGDWLYGKIEVRAKIPVGLGTWPVLWMLPTDSIYITLEIDYVRVYSRLN